MQSEDKLIAYKNQLKELVEIIVAHEIESCQCDGKEETYCDCLQKSMEKAKRLINSIDK